MTLIRWNPFRTLASLPLDVERFFEDFGLSSDTVWVPSVDVTENDEAYELRAELPGMKKEDIHVSIEDNVLCLKGEKKQESESNTKNVHRVERMYGKFERSFRIPNGVKTNEIKAKYENGVLTIRLPKSEEAKRKEIPVSVE